MAELDSRYSLEELHGLDANEIDDMTSLLETLTGDEHDPDQVFADTQRAIDSDGTTVNVIRDEQGGQLAATTTLNSLPVLHGNGTVNWIDDVATDPGHQGHGLSGVLMDKAEADAARTGDEVLLTSKPSREKARLWYERRGYQLGADATRRIVYRKILSAETMSIADTSEVEEVTVDAVDDVDQIAALTGLNRETVQANIGAVIESEHTALFVRRRMGAIAAVAVVNLCPIPTGAKPWVDDLGSEDEESRDAVLAASEQWLLERHAPYVNVIGNEDTELPADYEPRDTGLFIKTL